MRPAFPLSFGSIRMLTRWALITVVAITGFSESGSLWADDWQPAKGPLSTRWTKNVRADQVLPEYPRPQLVRDQWQNLNGTWEFAFGKAGEAPPLGKTLERRILVPFPVESALSGVMEHADRLWYRRTFEVPPRWRGQHVLLHFGAIDWEATVWVNGKNLGTHRGGYDAFTMDVTEALAPDGPQELVVGVFDPTDGGTQPRGKQVLRPGGIMYTPVTGIWQTVWLEPVPASRIEGLTIVPDVDGGKVRVTVNGKGTAAGTRVRVLALEDGRTVATEVGEVGREIALPIEKAKLWTPARPFLYGLRAVLEDGQDDVSSYFGMRKIALGKDAQGVTRLLLNGQFVFQVGPLDQGYWPDGIYTAPTDEALRFDIQITKTLGFNMTRKHVKVEPDRWYYWCDRLGLLVWQDMPAGDRGIGPNDPDLKRSPESARQYEAELTAMIDDLKNHPSIIMWVVFNEGWGQFDTARIVDLTRRLDPTRLVDGASGWTDRAGVGDVHDMHNYPGPGTFPPEPKRAAVLGEFGGLGLGVEGHTWSNKTWGYRGTTDRAELTRKYERLLATCWALASEKGLSAAVYTQLTDVETEANGLLTYDRQIVKVDVARASAVNRGEFSSIPVAEVVVPTSRTEPQIYRYTTERPGEGWARPDFDASGWKEGPGVLGTRGTPGATVRTEWNSRDIWVRRTIDIPARDPARLTLLLLHDEDAEVYLNGVLAARAEGYNTDYEEVAISDAARAAIRPGSNVLAIHCKQTGGGQSIDAGLVELKTRSR